MTNTSEPLATRPTRRARQAERQARVGILRNPNAPPQPPRRKAKLMGRWPSLQTARRPDLRTADAHPAPPALTDSELAQLLKIALPPLPAAATSIAADPAPPAHATLPDSSAPDQQAPAPPGHIRRSLALIGGFGLLIAVAFIAGPF